MTPSSPQHSSTEDRNYRHLVMDIAWFGLALAATSRFLQFFAIQMGADAMQLAWLTSLPALVVVLATGWSQWWRNRNPDSIRAVWLPSIGFRLVFLLPAFAPFFPEAWRIPWLIIAAALPAAPQGIAGAVFLVMLRETIPPERVTALLSHRTLAMNLTIMIGALGFGVLLEWLPFPLNYQVMFVLAFAFSLVSQWHIGRLHLLDATAADAATVPRPAPSPVSYRQLLHDRSFQAVAYITLLTYLAYFSIFAIVPLRLQGDLGATESFLGVYGVAELLSGALMTLVLHRIVQRIGNRRTIALSLAGTALGAFILATTPLLWLTLLAAALTGAAWTAASIGVLGFFTERTAADDLRVSMVFNQVIYLAMIIGPLLGSGLVMNGVSVVGVLGIGVGIRLLAALLIQAGLALFYGRRVEPLHQHA